jgi:hypothetical protein
MTLKDNNASNELLDFFAAQANEKKDWPVKSAELLNFLLSQSKERKDWFSFTSQRITAVVLAHDIARFHADKITPLQAVEYALELNEAIYHKIIKTTR